MAKTPRIGCILSTVGFLGFLSVVFFEFLSHHSVDSKLGYFKGGLLAIAFLLLGVVSADFTYRITSDFYSFRNLWVHYISLFCIRILSRIFYSKLLNDTSNVATVQKELLLSYIKKSRNTYYGREHGFSELHSVSDFLSTQPLTRYDHYEQYIHEIAAGKRNVMSEKLPDVLAMTSGTSGQPKMLPSLRSQRTVFFLYGILPVFHIMFSHMTGIKNLQKKLKFFYTPKWRMSEGGIPIGPNSSSPSNSQAELSFHSTPAAAFDILTEPEALYVYLLFGLRDRKLGYLEANFASLIYTAFVTLERQWPRLVADIRNGCLSDDLDIDPEIRQKLNSELTPDPVRADELQTQFERGFVGIAQQIWPFMSFVLCVKSGAFKVYAELLQQKYCKGIHIYSPIYAATEGLIAINLWPERKESYYTLLPRAMFYEFIPIADSEEDQPATLLMHQLIEGEIYEMVISNTSGLYRYRFGDVVKVVGFHNEAPLIEFLYRQGQLLNVRGEKTSENHLYNSLRSAMKTSLPNHTLVDYCCVEKLAIAEGECSSPSYQIFLEVSGASTPTKSRITSLAAALDDELQSSYIYKSFRVKGSIGAPSLLLVKPGTFSQYRLRTISQEKATPNQFKIPRVLRQEEAITFMQNASVEL